MQAKSYFRPDEGLIYLNSGTHSLAPTAALEAVTRFQRDYEKNPTRELEATFEKLWTIQKRLAAFFGARPEDMFLRPNVSIPLNNFILQTKLAPGQSIVLSDLEYGAVANMAQVRAEREGRTLHRVKLPATRQALANLSPGDLAQLICKQIPADAGLLILSHVITSIGLVLPIEEIGRETRRRGISLVVDGAHAPGALPLDFKRLDHVDYYAGNLHKWIMGPKGTAFAWVHPSKQKELEAQTEGWTSFSAPGPFATFGGGHRFAERFLMTGCHDFAPFIALHASLDLWEKLGPDNIRTRLAELQRHLEKVFAEELGFEELSPPQGPLRGPQTTYAVPPEALKGVDGFTLMMRIEREKKLQIQLGMLASGTIYLRLTPHIYNDEAEIDRAAQILRGVFK